MKKILLVAMVAAMLLSAASCSTGGAPGSSTVIGSASSQSQSEPATEKPTETAKTASIGEYVQSDTLKITLTSAKVYDEIVQNEYMKATPADGKKYLVLFLEAENKSDEDQYVNMFNYEAYADDKSIKSTALLVNPEDEDMFSGDLAPGKKLSGYVAYEVNKNWKEFEFTYKDGALTGSTKFSFAFSSEDIK